jgi:hypothetical protein
LTNTTTARTNLGLGTLATQNGTFSDKLNKNTTITGNTKTKITYDTNGLVTSGTDLVSGDIPDIAQSQVTGLTTTISTLATKAITVRKISTATTLADSDNGTVILLTASCTVTLPNGLSDGFNCSFATQSGATLTYSLGGSVTLINNSATTMPPVSTHTIVNTGTANEYLTVGL